ncbi:RHS repeat-associated core domain-containing protein [Blastococcus sp. KM273128]|nr:RHS repeat-associated core domain-containing protein [Blastococcus sp. KM273128]
MTVHIAGLGTAVYKADGQMTRLATSTTTSAYTYAGADQTELIRETRADGLNNVYAYGRTDANGIPLVKAHTVGLNTLDNTAFLVHDPQGTPIALRTPDGQVHYYAQDGLGSVTHLTNQDGATTGTYSYDPWGGSTTGQNAVGVTRFNPYGYAGGIDDPNSTLVHFAKRWYDPATGRFTQPDSLETLGDPSRANRYEYAASNPINYVDPTGLVDCGLAAGAGGILGGIVGAGFGGFASGGNPVGAAVGFVKGVTSGYEVTQAVCESNADTAGGRVLDGVEAYFNVDVL